MEILKVLVVDDEPGIRSGVSRVLNKYSVSYPFMEDDIGYDITEVASGEEAIRIFSENKPDIVLLDNKLPGMGGVEVLEFINRNNLDIEVMMITSFASLELAVRATNIGAYDFVPKPFTPQELRASMDNITKHLFLKRMTRKMNTEGKQIRFQFLSVLSHELKNPINAIEGYLRMIQERQAGESIGDYDEIVDRALARIHGMRALIMDMLDLTKIESGRKSREIRETDLVGICRISIETMGPLAIQMEVEMHLEAPEKLIIMTDPEEIEIILNNLISNAIKYNKTGGRVIVRINSLENHAEIEVEDTGIGIPEEDQPLLFKDFVRIRRKETKNITGSGLGLSIVKRLLDLNGGSIEFKSKPGEGSLFRILLPMKS